METPKTFNIVIRETLARTITIVALDEYDALMEVEKQYENEEIVLDANDFVDVDFEVEAE